MKYFIALYVISVYFIFELLMDTWKDDIYSKLDKFAVLGISIFWPVFALVAFTSRVIDGIKKVLSR